MEITTIKRAFIEEIVINRTFDYAIPIGVVSVWVCAGGHFQLEHDITTDDGLDKLVYWWVQSGRREFTGIRDLIDDYLLRNLHLTPLRQCMGQSDGLELTGLQSLILRHRADLKTEIAVEQGIVTFWNWWLSAGQREYFGDVTAVVGEQCCILLEGLSHDVSVLDEVQYQALLNIKPIMASDAKSLHGLIRTIHLDHFPKGSSAAIDLTPLMRLIHRNRPDLRSVFDAETQEGIIGLWEWWLSAGQSEYLGKVHWLAVEQASDLLGLLVSEIEQTTPIDVIRYRIFVNLLSCAERYGSPASGLLNKIHFDHFHDEGKSGAATPTPLMFLVYRNRPDLQLLFDLQTQAGLTKFWGWWLKSGQHEYSIRPMDDVQKPERQAPASKDLGASNDPDTPFVATEEVRALKSGDDVSLVGYPKGEFGLGEDIRLLRTSLNAAGIKPNVIKAPWTIMARQAIDEPSVEADVAKFDVDVMIYVMPAFDTLTLLNKVGPSAFSARRKIGFWQWELERFPPPAKMAMELVDEIWCHSEHSARAFQGATDKPVITVPLPVLVPDLPAVPRSKFGLQDDSFVVFTSFDGASSISRKNPLGAILAFQEAFPRTAHGEARLIVKAMNVLDDSLWRECMRKAAQDPRIIIRNTVMDRLEYYELLQCCDVVLSLHRAEGFGRLMAEAMALGIPVVASAYSGNMDFMNDKNSWLVSGETLPVLFGDYPFYQDQIWFEPDVGSAAEALRDCASNAEKRGQFVIAAKQTMDRYSTQNCGREYLKLLKSRASK